MCHRTEAPNNSCDQDDDVLRAAIDFIDAFEQEHGAESQQRDQRPRYSLQRVKKEIRSLRELATQLEERVAVLEQRRLTQCNAKVMQIWEILAEQHKHQRIQAEMENRQLRELLEKQSRIARRLERVLLEGPMERDHEALQEILYEAEDVLLCAITTTLDAKTVVQHLRFII